MCMKTDMSISREFSLTSSLWVPSAACGIIYYKHNIRLEPYAVSPMWYIHFIMSFIRAKISGGKQHLTAP